MSTLLTTKYASPAEIAAALGLPRNALSTGVSMSANLDMSMPIGYIETKSRKVLIQTERKEPARNHSETMMAERTRDSHNARRRNERAEARWYRRVGNSVSSR